MSLILDAGALIAYERADVVVRARLRAISWIRQRARTSAAVVAQVWRDGARQALLARLLPGLDEVALTPDRARAIGRLLAWTGTTDIVDATLVELASKDGDEILTSDPEDLGRLAEASGKRIVITRVS